ncbi:hypothetical protein GXW82_19830 [Streptacidiphilus sp. 4-A2]|nr:hypothetical protein [Streptacidiphilus sp. 4-A2]
MAQQSPGPAAEPGPEPAGGPPAQPPRRALDRHAAVLAAVVGAALAVPPTPRPRSPTARTPCRPTPRPARAAFPLRCGGVPVQVSQSFGADLTGDGNRRHAWPAPAPAGRPLSAGGRPRPRVADVLMSPALGFTVRSVTFRSDGSIAAAVDGYSSPNVPRCCADVHESFTWTPHGHGYLRTVSVPDAET